MKKIKLISFTTICIIIIQILMPILIDIDWNTVFAEDNTNTWDISVNGDGSVIAKLSEDGTLTISGSGNMKNWRYDATTDWHSIENKEKVKNVIIKEGVTSIGDDAFDGCSSLTNITIPEGVTRIGRYAFSECSSLTNINVSENSKNYLSDNGVLYTKNKTELIRYPEGKKETEYIIPNSVTSIGDYAFSECSNLTNITIPEGVTSIGDYAFYQCSNLTNITIPEGVASIGNDAFSKCSSLTNITIPEGVTSIGDYAFFECSSLTNIIIPEGVTSIGNRAFQGCNSLTNITIPEGVTSIGDFAFSGCSSLENIKVSENSKNYLSDNGVLYTKNKTELIRYPEGKKETEYIIPNSVTSIGKYAFSGCSSLTNITIPEGVTSIGISAFSKCSSLTNITIPEGVTSIGDCAFYQCSSLTNIIIPEGVTSIGNRAFFECSSLTNITISEGVTSIGKYAFSGCSSLTNITIPEGVTSIGDCAFYQCSSLTNIIIPEGVTSIGKYAFYGCSSLTIYCTSNSYAKEYAIKNNIEYIIDDQAPTITSVTGNENWQKNEITLTIQAEDNQSGLATEAYSFDNGQTWQKENTKKYTENTNGVVIKVRDALGNIATYETINIDKIFKIKDYAETTKEEENYLTKISQNTTISKLKEKIETNAPIKIIKGEQEIIDENTLVGTGMNLQIGDETYTLVVTGDLNGDGKIGLTDLANLKLTMVGKRELSTASTLAGDINGDGKTSLSDLAKLKMYLVGKITI